MPTLKEQLTELTGLKHRLAVWETMHKMMDDSFVEKDGQIKKKGIRVPNCIVDMVAEDVIEDVLQTISDGPISELKAKIEEIENRDVVLREAAANG